MFKKYLQTRRATRALASAMRRKDLGDMRYAIEQGANLDHVSDVFDEPAQHFQMSYEIKGALPLAIENRLPVEAFQILLDAGACVPTKFGGRPHPEALFTHEDISWSLSDQVLALIKNHAERATTNPQPQQAMRRPGR